MDPRILKRLLIILLAFGMSLGCKKLGNSEASHHQAAREVVEFEFSEDRFKQSVFAVLESESQSGSVSKEERPIYLSWIHEVYSDKTYLENITAVKMKHYSESDLREIAKFYKSSSGQRFLQIEPTLMKEMSQIVKQNAEAHFPDLISRIQKFNDSAKQNKP